MQNNIFRILLIIRECMKKEFDNFPISCCYETSLVAERVFTKLGYNVKVIEGVFDGVEHYWNIIDDSFYDITADQFGCPYGEIKNYKKYVEVNNQYSLDDELMYLEDEDDNDEMFVALDELKETKKRIIGISNKCLKMLNLSICA